MLMFFFLNFPAQREIPVSGSSLWKETCFLFFSSFPCERKISSPGFSTVNLKRVKSFPEQKGAIGLTGGTADGYHMTSGVRKIKSFSTMAVLFPRTKGRKGLSLGL
ncbi:hypothetical protein [Sanguibacteroides justesenii]|uniref:hypothetical protein n=1 Tax=Sanguibacteroides justesenii TaxID=1547597 RepID=UPI00126A04DD|nr:hypothetical protein [Sanguibacteroides justesenii]